jgi:transcriptional regulator with XRE-family HTH domain
VSDQNDLAKFDRKAYRDGYLQAKVRGMIAYQIQALREKTGLNQTDFAERIGKTQSVVSRLENTEYGRVSVQTLLDVACALDVALVVKFASYPDFLTQTRNASATALQPQTIQETARVISPPAAQLSISSAQPFQRLGAAYNRFLKADTGQQGKSAQDYSTNDNEQDQAKASIYQQNTAMPALKQAGGH